jgi:hypothetical protein
VGPLKEEIAGNTIITSPLAIMLNSVGINLDASSDALDVGH